MEIAHLSPTAQVGIRDSKTPHGPTLTVPATAFAAFLIVTTTREITT